MPRSYCQVTKVTQVPFNVVCRWVNPIHPVSDTFLWLKKLNLSMSIGQFKLGNDVEFDKISRFSHLMKAKTHKRNGFEIYPKTSEVWAVYRDYDKELPNSNARKVGMISNRTFFLLK